MKRIALSAVPVEDDCSPKGRFHLMRKKIPLSLGARDGDGHAIHPYEVEYVELLPGARKFPYHTHTQEHETYLITEGHGKMRIPSGEEPITAGDCLHCAPEEPHQVVNDSDAKLCYYVIANNPASDISFYPDSNKWMMDPVEGTFRLKEHDYFDGEE